jgi:hypothetical protein
MKTQNREIRRTKMPKRYIVQAAQANMPASVVAPYMRVAVLAVDDKLPQGFRPKMISPRAKGVVEVVEVWERCHRGFNDGPNTAYQRALKEATALAAELNNTL